MCSDPGFGPLDENEATYGARFCASCDLNITADGDLHEKKKGTSLLYEHIKHLIN